MHSSTSYQENLSCAKLFITYLFINLLLKVFCFTVGDASQSLCVVQEDCIDVLTKDGALFTITLPFPVSSL